MALHDLDVLGCLPKQKRRWPCCSQDGSARSRRLNISHCDLGLLGLLWPAILLLATLGLLFAATFSLLGQALLLLTVKVELGNGMLLLLLILLLHIPGTNLQHQKQLVLGTEVLLLHVAVYLAHNNLQHLLQQLHSCLQGLPSKCNTHEVVKIQRTGTRNCSVLTALHASRLRKVWRAGAHCVMT